MKRLTILELHERPWFPQHLRDGVTDALGAVMCFGHVYAPIAGDLSFALQSAKSTAVVDLCSGGGGPWDQLSGLLNDRDGQFQVCLTDKFPNLSAFEAASRNSRGRVCFSTESVDAKHIPSNLRGFRTVFSSFHHFSPPEASAILQHAVDSREGIAAFEAARRRFSSVLLTVLVSAGCLLAVPRIRPFRFSLFLWTYLLPVIPFVLWFDGVISCLRAYSPAELQDLVSQLPPNNYAWEIGEKRGLFSPVTYLIGYPAPSAPAAAAQAVPNHSAA